MALRGSISNALTAAASERAANISPWSLAYTTPSGIASGFGRVGGLSTGASVNAGAWDGTSSVIGCNFATGT